MRVRSWGGYMHYLAEALELLPDYAGVAYRALGGRYVRKYLECASE